MDLKNYCVTITCIYYGQLFKVGCVFKGTRLKSNRDKNPPAFKINPIKIHPVKFENYLPIEGKGRGNSDSEKKYYKKLRK